MLRGLDSAVAVGSYDSEQIRPDAVKPGLVWEGLALTVNRVLAEGLADPGLAQWTKHWIRSRICC